jgi:uncharacterized protein YdhG (YjbR/CyaY superfamily)
MTFPKETRKILRQVRAAIKAAAPGTKETISYNIPTFTLDGKYLIYFAGWKNHVSLYPIPSGTEAFNKEVAKYAAGKGTLKFPLDEPVPLKLIGRIVKYRLESLKQAKTKYGK